MSCNFGLNSYLWSQMELALRARAILKSRVWFLAKLHSTPFNYHHLSRVTQAKHQFGARAFWAAISPALPNHWLLLISYRSCFFRQAAVNNGKKHVLVNAQESLPTSLLQQITVSSGSTEGTGSSGMCQCRCTCGGQFYHNLLFWFSKMATSRYLLSF